MPDTPAVTRLDALGRPVPADRVTVALLLPLSGRGSEVGPAMLRAGEMAMFDAAAASFELIPYDTKGTTEGATEAANAALSDGAQLILGPLFGTSVQPVAALARSAGVNVVGFTNDSTVAGDNAFIMGFLPEGQVDRVVQYSMTQGLTRFAALAPGTAYGRIAMDALRDAARRRNAVLAVEQFYNPADSAYDGMVRDLAARKDSFDAVMIPDSGISLRGVATLLPFYGVEEARILGTSVWDTPDIGVETSLIGGWFAAAQPDLRFQFERRYAGLFGEQPPRLATLGYDAVALAAALARLPDGPRFDRAALTDPGGFTGIDGIFRFGVSGHVDRGLAIMEVTAAGPVVREAAPTSFAGTAF
ncbi:MAG: penicillin-binding protein activator [Inquilinaceae bacterium]